LSLKSGNFGSQDFHQRVRDAAVTCAEFGARDIYICSCCPGVADKQYIQQPSWVLQRVASLGFPQVSPPLSKGWRLGFCCHMLILMLIH
jgi:hypothetical protein